MNDDDVDFKPSQSTSSNLTSLFDTNSPRPSDNQTLRYTAPKPPKAGESSGTTVREASSKNLGTEKLEIIVSKNIQLYKLENGKYVGQGAAGVAIIGHYDLHMYQIILYKNNKEYLSKTYIQPNFTFTVLENNYASFYDNARQNWSILFPSSSDVHLFAKQVAIAKYNSQSKQEKIIVQDLMPVGSAKANKHDIVNLEISCSLLNRDDITPLKEKSNWSIEVTDTYTFPWQEGLKDCSYKCKRVVITPYKLSAPWRDEIQENDSVLVEFEVESMRPPERLGQNKTLPVKANTQDESATDSSADEENCKTKPISLKDSIFLSRSHKADLISRIAKMGQALPSKVAFACGPSDSSNENSSASRQANSLRGHHQMNQTLPGNFRPCSPQQTDTNQPYLLSSSSSRRCENDIAWQQQQMRGGMNFAYQELYPMTSGPPGPSGQTNVRGTETTGTDAELRITINKVSEKVDHVLNKLQNFDSTGWDKVKAHQSATILDPISVINSIQDVMAENESLKAEIQQQKSKINEQGSKLHSLMELTQRCVERCAYPERKPVSTPGVDKIVGLEERLDMSDQLMKEANTRMNQLTWEIEKYRKEITENQQQIRQCNTEIQSLVDKLKEKERVIRYMETELVETTAANEALLNANKLQKKEMQSFKEPDAGEKSSEAQAAMPSDSVEEIKKVMNAVNRKLQTYFDPDQFYSGKDIKATIATTLKDVTMEYLKYRNKQKTAYRSDVQRDLSGANDEKMGTSHVQLAPEYNKRDLETVDADNWRKEKSKIGPDLIKASSQRLAFADEQTSQTKTNIRERPAEEPVKLHSRLAQESSVHVTGKPSLRRSMDLDVSVDDVKTVESLVHPAADTSKLHQRDLLRTASSRPIMDARSLPKTDASALSHDMKSVETVGVGSQRESDVPSRISGEMKSKISEVMRDTNLSSRFNSVYGDQDAVSGKLSGVTTTGSSTSTRTLPGASKTSVTQPSTRRSTLPISRLPSGGDESIKGDISTMTGELESLLEDHEAENVEVKNSIVTLTNTLSDVTRGPTAPPSSYRSIITGKAQTSSNLGTGSSYVMEDSRTQSTATTVVQPSETDKQIRKQFSNKSETGTTSGAESFVFVEKEKSDGTHLGSSKGSRVSEIRATPGRSAPTVRGQSSEIDDSTKIQNAGNSSSRTVAGDESLVFIAKESSEFVTDMSSEGVIPQESGIQPTSGKSTRTANGLPSEMDVSFAKYDVYSKSGTENEDEEHSSIIDENNRFKDGSIKTMEASNPASNFTPSTTEREAWDIGKSISETHLNSKIEAVTPVEEGSIANVETEKLSVLLNKTVSNTTRDTSIQGHVELGSDYGSSTREDFEERDEDNSQLEQEEKSYTTREDMEISNENENEKDETEKSSIDEKVSSSNSDENFKSSGSNAAHESPLYFKYYQGWESSKPPPLPLEDEEESSGTDEEWL